MSATSRRNRGLLLKYKKENVQLSQQIQQYIQSTSISQSVRLNERMNRMNDFADQLVMKIQSESGKLQDYENQLEVLEAQIMDARIDMGGVDTSKRNSQLIEKQISVLENRLDKCLKKYSSSISKNKELRQEIENLREERVVFDSIYKKMETELHEKKKQMAEIIEKSNEAYEQRDEAVEELKKLQQLSAQVNAEYAVQFNELDEIIRTDDELNSKLKEQEKKRSEGLLGSLSRDQQQRLEKKVIKQNWSLAEQRAKYLVHQEKVKQYNEMFRKIQEATNLSIDELIEKFQEAENTNFSLFTYVNELNSQVEKLESDIASLTQNIREHETDDASTEVQRKNKLVQVQDQVKQQNTMAEEFALKHQDTLGVLKSLTSSIQTMFQGIGCDEEQITQMLGTSKVSENNIMIYLGIIEQRTNYLIQNMSEQQEPQDLNTSQAISVIGAGPKHAYNASDELTIEPPSTGEGLSDDSDDDEESERPLTRTELIQKAKKIEATATTTTKKRKQ
uniref:ODAD1 central coiled coil region domain-containing protein n=1 Tax=Percolomonas cosmopolitus TaxID=63605 RepID=A0A7S1KMS6_9EUKA|mmetsp:Transcript_2054/g.7394  ORF Transcript_2054/g.7394 Transcript_2054/m.7394 type:complete len:506 (+) Transcript_2054:242-1759(+)|eukprot:CAMPEP_0117445822 /NCGR_PEP_ID=MMETSP0759-20121206/6003_1 /TAXON_ID=63605 /ORGANISM="Percolomonas cosmopolitus, Strain WS" /LENGTH=505 /DNA_ID=CAMNT_0005238029 /DNA_START=235 /DNA_END=1752 /DNA_ORIENTATION=+